MNAQAEFNVVEATIADIHAAYLDGRLTARRLVEAYFARIAAYDKVGPAINAVISTNPKALEEAEKTLDRWYGALENLPEDGAQPGEAFMAALQDDLNTPGAIAELFTLVGENPAQARASARLLGLFQMSPADWSALRQADLAIAPQAIEALIEARLAARAAK
jgi:cysteinyl-tRNA synthetase